MNPDVDFYFSENQKWQHELEQLRAIVLDCGLTEELKWRVPCYTFQNNNIVLLHTFKEYCALLFFKGALLSDPDNILIQQTKNVQAARQVRFTNTGQITAIKQELKSYIYEAVEVEKAGLKVILKKTDEFVMVEEFKVKLKASPELEAAFNTLTPGRQRAYLLHFSSAKQTKTREARIEKSIPGILEGKGPND